MIRKSIYILGSLFFLAWGGSSSAQDVYSAHTTTRLVGEYQSISPGSSHFLAISMKMDPEWHVYWRNPGDSGVPPQIEWSVPDGVTLGPIQWPTPERISIDPLMSYGYHGDILLPVRISLSENYRNASVRIQGTLIYLACKIACVPGEAVLEINLPVKATAPIKSVWYSSIQESKNHLPLPVQITAQFIDDGDVYRLQWINDKKGNAAYYFFPFRDDILNHFHPQKLTRNGNIFELRLKKSSYHPPVVNDVAGILYRSEPWYQNQTQHAMELQLPVQKKENHLTGARPSRKPFWLAMLFAFVGGLILNLMPCVLPVLSIKVLNIIQKSNQNHAETVKQGIQFAGGILSAFWFMVVCLWLLKRAGQDIGWGFQFQSPVFVMGMIILFFVMALNLFGVFEFRLNMQRFVFLQKSGSFWEGVLTTIVATPCTAPFMGSALAFALTQNFITSFWVFTMLGLGLAAPFLALIFFPALRQYIPKPGPWMIILKKVFGCLFLLTVAWLIWILSDQVNLPFSSHQTQQEKVLDWEVFSPELIEQYQDENRIIFLDFTARWCLTCQVNERVALSNSEVINKFKNLDVVLVKADWTNYDQNITRALEDLGRNAIPLYVLYPKNKGDPILLPELLTPGLVMDYLNKVN